MKPSKLLLWCLLLVLLSCVYDNKNLAPVSEAKQIVLPGGLETYNFTTDRMEVNPETNYSLKIFTTINVSCATCILKFEEWKKFQTEARNCAKVLLVPVCTSKDKFEMFKYLAESNRINKLDFPLLLDSSQAFGALNKQFANDMSGVSVLTDADNMILLTGNPIESPTDRQLFLDKICELNGR